MYASLYEDGHDNADSPLIVGIIDQAFQSRPEIAMIAHFMRDGCAIMLLLVGHNAVWYINWNIDKPDILDTGIGYLSLSDPGFDHKLEDQAAKIATYMVQSCVCNQCRTTNGDVGSSQ